MSEQETAGWLQREMLVWLLPRVKQGARLAGQAEHAGRCGVLLTLIRQNAHVDRGPAKMAGEVITTTTVRLRYRKPPKQ
jgi:hypothetical protein